MLASTVTDDLPLHRGTQAMTKVDTLLDHEADIDTDKKMVVVLVSIRAPHDVSGNTSPRPTLRRTITDDETNMTHLVNKDANASENLFKDIHTPDQCLEFRHLYHIVPPPRPKLQPYRSHTDISNTSCPI